MIENLKKNLLINFCRVIPIIFLIGAISYIIILLLDKKNWDTTETNVDVNEELLSKRTTNRGTFVSICNSIFLSIIGAIMVNMGVREELVVVNFGFVFTPVMGYILDQAIGSDEGFSYFKKNNLFVWFKYILKRLPEAAFFRYIITVLLDLFISNPLQDILKIQANKAGIISYLKESKGFLSKWDNLIALNFPNFLQAIVGFITFQAYTNETRFKWAYPEKAILRAKRISPGTIMICTALASIVYLSFYKMMEYNLKHRNFNMNTKLIYAVIAIILLYILNKFDTMEAPVGDEYKPEIKGLKKYKLVIGLCLFILIIFYGVVYPFSTVLMK